MGVVPGRGVSLNGEELRGIGDGVSPLDSGTGDDDERGLFDGLGGREGEELGVRWLEDRFVRTGRLRVPWNLTREPLNLPTTPSQ